MGATLIVLFDKTWVTYYRKPIILSDNKAKDMKLVENISG